MDWSKIVGTGLGAMALGPAGAFLGYKAGGGGDFSNDLTNGFNVLSGKKGLDTAAAGAREAQAQANALAQLQWQRQMQGLQEARGQTQPYLSLYDKIYGTQTAGRQTPVGGMAPGLTGTGGGGMGSPPPVSVGPGLPPGQRSPGPNGQTYPGQTVSGTFAPVMRGNAPITPHTLPPSQSPGQQQPMPTAPFMGRPQSSPLEQYLRSMGAMR